MATINIKRALKLIYESSMKPENHGIVNEKDVVEVIGCSRVAWWKAKQKFPELQETIDTVNNQAIDAAKVRSKKAAAKSVDKAWEVINKYLEEQKYTNSSVRSTEGQSAKQGKYSIKVTSVETKRIPSSIEAAKLVLKAASALEDNVQVHVSTKYDDTNAEELTKKAKAKLAKLGLMEDEDGEDD